MTKITTIELLRGPVVLTTPVFYRSLGPTDRVVRSELVDDFGFYYVRCGRVIFESAGQTLEAAQGDFVIFGPRRTVIARARNRVVLLGGQFQCSWCVADEKPAGSLASDLLEGCYGKPQLDNILFLPDHKTIRQRGKVGQCLLELIENELADPDISLAAIAEKLGLTPDYLGRLFKQHLGETLGRYLQTQRMAVAKDLMTASNMRVKDVRAAVGFRDPLYFSKAFRKLEQMSPMEFIRQQNSYSPLGVPAVWSQRTAGVARAAWSASSVEEVR